MKNLFKVLAIFFSLVFSQISIAEIIVSTQEVTSPDSIIRQPIKGEFNDYWTFNLSQTSNVIGTVTNDMVTGIFNIENLKASLFSVPLGSTAGNSQIYSPVANDLNLSSNGFLFHNLASGDYAIGISGLANGQYGGRYEGLLTISPVPEPKEWAMMILSLSLMGFVSARRKKSV